MVYKLDKAENALRQRCRLRRVERGTRHPEASISQKEMQSEKEEAEKEGERSSLPLNISPVLSSISTLPTGVPLAKLCEGSDGEDWEQDEKRSRRPERRAARRAVARAHVCNFPTCS